MVRRRLLNPAKPCAECPWRRDVPPGQFEPERFRSLARTAYDMSSVLFQCHKSSDQRPTVCAGFLLRGALHNLAVRLAISREEIGSAEDGGYPMVADYREMAIRNGVDPDDTVLMPCR